MVEIDQARPIIQRALDLGVTYFDTANQYSNGRSEEIVGEVLKEHRDEVFIGTKVFFPMGSGVNERGLSRIHLTQQIQASLKRLQTDYVDLYTIHRWDYETPIEETLRTLDGLVEQDKVRYLGASSMWAWQLGKALWVSEKLELDRFIAMQNFYNLCYREEEREMINLCKDQGIALTPWSPLARGFLTGKYKREQQPDSARYHHEGYLKHQFFREEDFDVTERVVEVAIQKGVKPAQIALAWLFNKPHITSPILGVSQIRHIEEAVEALEIKLSTTDMKHLDEPYKPNQIMGHS